jgi:hypothetical protein
MGCEGANNVLPARQDEVHSTGWVDRSSSRSGVVLLGMGAVANEALEQCGLGFFVPIDTCDATVIDGEGTALAQMLELGNQIVDPPRFPQQKAF